jgi:hypothetical protein
MEPRLQMMLSVLEQARRKMRLSRALAIWWGSAALVVFALMLIQTATGRPVVPSALFILVSGLVIAVVIWIWEKRRPLDLNGVVRELERDCPAVRTLLSTAFEQQPDPVTRRWNYLQMRVIEQVLKHPQRRQWREKLRSRRLAAMFAHTLALVAFLAAFSFARTPASQSSKPWFADNITVEPGDVELERGSGLVITIRFEKQAPSEATLVVESASGQLRRISLDRHLEDPLFGASLGEMMENSVYHIEYGEKKTRDYAIKVFEFPALLRADASLAFPDYTGLTNKNIPDTLRVTAVEGSRLTFQFQLNKPVAQARLMATNGMVSLVSGSNGVMLLNDFVLTNSGRYALQLVDAEGRTNRRVSEVVVQVLPNRRPDVKLAFPRGDQRVSNLQELQLLAEVADDFGVLKYGFGFGVAGEDPGLVELGQSTGANEKRRVDHLIDMERLGLQVDQLVSYFVWADDYGPDGEARRTFSDMFFAEVRPFEEIFRADQSSGGGEQQEQGGQQGGGGGNEPSRLSELQKQIVIATWKIQREKNATSIPKP